MIAGLPKTIILYLSPLLTLTTVVLTLFAYLAPTFLLHDRVALITVTPSLFLIQDGPVEEIDGPSIFIGTLGSCSRSLNRASITCASASLNPTYDVSVLPDTAPKLHLTAPGIATSVTIGVAVFLSIVFFISFTMISFRHMLAGRAATLLEKPVVQRLSAVIGFSAFLIGTTAHLIIRMWFGNAVSNFNNSVAILGQRGPALAASIGNGFTMVWVAYAFYAVPVVVSLAKLNVKASK